MPGDSTAAVVASQNSQPQPSASQLEVEEGVSKARRTVSENELDNGDSAFLFAASMWKRKSVMLGVFFLLIGGATASVVAIMRQKNQDMEGLFTVQPSINPVALKNPLKGWRGQISRYAWGTIPINDQGIPFSQPIWYTQVRAVSSCGSISLPQGQDSCLKM